MLPLDGTDVPAIGAVIKRNGAMKKIIIEMLTILIAGGYGPPVIGGGEKLYIVPRDGQSREQQAQDTSYCRIWAEEQTGVDPDVSKAKLEMLKEEQMSAVSTRREEPGGRIIRGAAVGAGMGALEKNIDDEVGRGAAQGALGAAIISRRQRRQTEQIDDGNIRVQKIRKLESQYEEYRRAFSACMDARGYSVK